MSKSAVQQFKLYLIASIIYSIIWLLKKTYRIQYTDEENLALGKKHHPKGTIAFACWHENSVALIVDMAKKHPGLCLMVSPSFDGDLTALIAHRLGYKTVRGSSTRQGRAARDAYLPLAAQGVSIAITVDGPLGPYRKAKAGIVDIARKCALPIIPLAADIDRQWRLRSWDRLSIPKPFTGIKIRYGAPILVAANLTDKEFSNLQTAVESHLNESEVKKDASPAR